MADNGRRLGIKELLVRTAIHLLLAGLVAASAGCANRNDASREPSLGLSHERAVDSIEAAKYLRSATDAELVTTRTPWRFGEYDGQVISTPNYRVYTTIQNERILERLPLFYERALDHYTKAIIRLPKPTMPLETFLFQTRTQWQAKTTEMLPDQARMFSNLGRGGFTTKGTSVLYYIDRYGYTRDTFAIAAHEGWHQYTQQVFKQQLPIWLEEGVATYMEGYRTNRDGAPEFMPAEGIAADLLLSGVGAHAISRRG